MGCQPAWEAPGKEEARGEAGKEISAWGEGKQPGEEQDKGWQEGWGMDGSLGACGRGFGNWLAAGPVWSRRTAVLVVCSRAGWGRSTIPAVRGHGRKWEQDGCCCVPSPSLSFVCAKVASLPNSFSKCWVVADLSSLSSPCPPATPSSLP